MKSYVNWRLMAALSGFSVLVATACGDNASNNDGPDDHDADAGGGADDADDRGESGGSAATGGSGGAEGGAGGEPRTGDCEDFEVAWADANCALWADTESSCEGRCANDPLFDECDEDCGRAYNTCMQNCQGGECGLGCGLAQVACSIQCQDDCSGEGGRCEAAEAVCADLQSDYSNCEAPEEPVIEAPK